MKSADEAPEIAVCCVLEDDTVVAALEDNSHQRDDVLMPQFAVHPHLAQLVR